MFLSKKASYKGGRHGGFDEEWGLHRGCSEWWYATGYFTDEAEKLYSFQFTVLRVRVGLLYPYIAMLALTDFSAGTHAYCQNVRLFPRDVTISPDEVAYGGMAAVRKGASGMTLTARHKDFMLDLSLGYGKGAVWHCDNGLLQMGIFGRRQTTTYYSYPNMPAAGTLTVNGSTKRVTGKAWFDKQGGPYSLLDRRTHWEWFSLRFFDDEELMLFSFPQDGYQDGTYIPKSGPARRLTAYTVTPTAFAYPQGVRYSCAWELHAPELKEERYTISPLMEGQMNLGYYELLAGVDNAQGERVGLCFVELLPGVYNEKFNRSLLRSTG